MRIRFSVLLRMTLLLAACASLASCDDPQVYGSVGFSNYHGGGGYYGGGGRRTSVSIGGRIY
jgi:hypothetical protein